jgi:hypothetical protein
MEQGHRQGPAPSSPLGTGGEQGDGFLRHEANEGEEAQAGEGGGQALVVPGEPPEAAGPLPA